MPPLERLNYYPGQRLDAVDLKLEADYELTVRRLLNQGLFTAGVVSGLEAKKTGPREVTVAPGLALDAQGRELYLADPTPIAVPNRKPAGGGDTYYLLITYDEQLVPASGAGCTPSNGAKTFSRIRQTPWLALTADWPNPQLCTGNLRDLNCGIFLASVTLDNDCKVATVDTGLRQYSFPANSSQVHEGSYEGEKDIAPSEPKRLFFYIRGGPPHVVTLYLRGAEFSRLWYTEMGDHTHKFSANANAAIGQSTRTAVDLTHTHTTPDSGGQLTGNSGHPHNHGIWTVTPSQTSPTFESVGTVVLSGSGYWDHNISITGNQEATWIGPPTALNATTNPADPAPDHSHSINLTSLTTNSQSTSSSPMDHTHPFDAQQANIGDAGVTDVSARTGAGELANSSITDMQVKLDGVDITAHVLKFLQWTTPLGGTQFNNDTGASGIDLLRLPPVTGIPDAPQLGPGKHILEFFIQSGSGGKLLYNLYVE